MFNKTMMDIINKYPWLAEENVKLILSPDSDGFLSALLYLNYFNAEVVGYYDCKIMLCKKDINPKDCFFVDHDIFCKDIKSCGHHMVCYNKNKKSDSWSNFDNAVQLNNLRGFDGYHDFQRKYPFATIHFLLSLLENVKHIEISSDAIVPLLFSDGVFNNLFGYPENCLDWLKWLKADDEESLLHDVFFKDIPFSSVMEKMEIFFNSRDKFNMVRCYDTVEECVKNKKQSRTGHHMVLTHKNGSPMNIIKNTDETYSVFEDERKRVLGFISLISSLMGWKTMPDKWSFDNMNLYSFKKDQLGSSGGYSKLNQANYDRIISDKCFSMAMTANTTVEYTIDINGYFKK